MLARPRDQHRDGGLGIASAAIATLPVDGHVPAGRRDLRLFHTGASGCALLSDRKLRCWGEGTPTPTEVSTPAPLVEIGPSFGLDDKGRPRQRMTAMHCDAWVGQRVARSSGHDRRQVTDDCCSTGSDHRRAECSSVGIGEIEIAAELEPA